MNIKVYQQGKKDPFEIQSLKEIKYYSVVKDGQQILNKDFQNFSLNNIVSDVIFIGSENSLTIKSDLIASLYFEPHDEFDD